MSVAADKQVLKKRMDRFLWESRSLRARELRRLLLDYFIPFGQVAIIGGMVRDFARSGRDGFTSDVDLVIDVPANEVATFAEELGAIPNRFGGYAWARGRWKVDFWALETTWAYKEGHVNVGKLQDLTTCTFFDWDAILYDLETRTVHCDRDYFDRIRRGQLEINLMPTPSVNGNLLRAIRRILLWDVEAGPLLTSFIESHLSEETFSEIAATDRKLYAVSLVGAFESTRLLLGHLKCKEERLELATFYARQLPLPGLLSSSIPQSKTGASKRRISKSAIRNHVSHSQARRAF